MEDIDAEFKALFNGIGNKKALKVSGKTAQGRDDAVHKSGVGHVQFSTVAEEVDLDPDLIALQSEDS